MPGHILAFADQKPGLVRPFHLHPIGADVAHAGLRVFGDQIGGGKKWRRIFADRPSRHGQLGNVDILAVENIFLARRVLGETMRGVADFPSA